MPFKNFGFLIFYIKNKCISTLASLYCVTASYITSKFLEHNTKIGKKPCVVKIPADAHNSNNNINDKNNNNKNNNNNNNNNNKPGVEKCTTGSVTSLEKHSDRKHVQGDLPAGQSRVTPRKKKEKDRRQKWSRKDFKEVMYAFYMSIEKSAESHT